uniref:Uncharacterized protein n=1 Tax=Alexandrium monilatum TaxID=311494 RepID=A0A7S4Q220_9DINO
MPLPDLSLQLASGDGSRRGEPAARRQRLNTQGDHREPRGQRGRIRDRSGASSGRERAEFQLRGKDLRTLAKALARTMQRVRILEGAVLLSVVLPTTHELTKKLLEARKSYGDACAAKGRRHELGPPHPYLWQEFLTFTAEHQTVPEPAKSVLKAALTAAKQFEVEDFSNQCSELVVEKMFSANDKRLLIHVETPELNLAVKTALRALGGKLLVGKAPPGALERLVQDLIEK